MVFKLLEAAEQRRRAVNGRTWSLEGGARGRDRRGYRVIMQEPVIPGVDHSSTWTRDH
jgi:hypothetical protein